MKTDTMTPSNFRLLAQKKIVLILFVISSINSFAQYDVCHYIPPFYSRDSSNMEIGIHDLFLSTNNEIAFDVIVTKSDGTQMAIVTISKTSPAQVPLGWNYYATGIVRESQLNTPLADEGVIAKASQPFFANIRHISAAQGMSLTSKGSLALGTRFRSGHLYSVESSTTDGPLKSHMISVMAIEDNTIVKFSEMKTGVIFFNTPITGNTSDDITVTLNKYETYVIAAHIDEPLSTGNDTLINGVLIESNLPIAVNSGSWCGGADITNSTPSRDIGMDQIVPTKLLGKEYIISKRFSFNEEECERVIVIADEENTEIFINGNTIPEAKLNAGEFVILKASLFNDYDNMYITSNEEVYVYQSTNGSESLSHAQGLNFIPPILCSGIHEVTIPNIDSFENAPAGIDIIAKVGSSVFVNGNVVSVASSPVTGNANWEVYKLFNLTGTVNVWSDNNINVAMISHSGARGSAGYFSGFSQFDFYPSISARSDVGDNIVAEGCVNGEFIFTKPVEYLDEDRTYYFEVSGDAINGVDYAFIPNSIFIPAGTLQTSIPVNILSDLLKEQMETITLTWMSVDDCETKTITKSLVIDANAEINFEIESGVQCLPFDAKFINHSTSTIGSTYHWDFGDGSSSNESDPIHIYTDLGMYNVTLTIESSTGCMDTILLMMQDLVNTHPTPIAGFSTDLSETDICNSLVNFIDESIGATTLIYDFDDLTASLTNKNPAYLYMNDGAHHPMQIAISEFGCRDTAYQELFIEPFTIYAPNTFTPDGNELNNTFLPIVYLELYEWDLQLFDRWGQIVFESQDPEIGWDGVLPNGVKASDGTYLWKITYVSCEPINPRHQMTGHVNLLQ